MTEPRALGTARDHDELIELLRARKNELGLSNQFVDQVGGIADGHCDQLLGPSGHKGLGRLSLNALLAVLAVDVVLVESPDKLRDMDGRFEQRKTRNVHAPARISKRALDRIKPVVLSEWSVNANARRNRVLTRKQRQAIARNAAKAKWRKFRKKKRKKTRQVGGAFGLKRRRVRALRTGKVAFPHAAAPQRLRQSADTGAQKGKAPPQSACSPATALAL